MPPAQGVRALYKAGVRHFALVDHDTFAGLPEAWNETQKINAEFPDDPLTMYTGAELSVRGGAHVLALNFDSSNPKLVAQVELVRTMRLKRAKAVVDALNQRFKKSSDPKERKVRIRIEEVVAKSRHAEGGSIGRPHIARVLVDKGLVRNVDEAFDDYLKGNIGGQNYEVPAGIDPLLYNEIWVWCRAFSVPFAKAVLM